MRTVNCRVTVYFDDPFWAVLYERESGDWYEASRTVFGAEPKDHEVYAFLLQSWRRLRFSPPIPVGERPARPDNPKRRQRAARQRSGTGTRAQQALAAQREQGKTARRIRTREEKAREAAERYEKHRQKRREKHKGH